MQRIAHEGIKNKRKAPRKVAARDAKPAKRKR